MRTSDGGVERRSKNRYRSGITICGNHAGAHKVNNTIDQAFLAKHLGMTRVIAETGAGQHPYPMLVRGFQCIIGREVIEQSRKQMGQLPDVLMACVGGGSNAIGLFHPFIELKGVRMTILHAAGE